MRIPALLPAFGPGARPAAAAVGAVLLSTTLLARADGVLIGRVARIHDGDSVTLVQQDRSVMVRLAGIDAPELAQPFGPESRENLRACSYGRIVVVETRGTDRHGRVLGTLETGATDCGLHQLQAGLAWHYRRFADEQPVALRQRYSAAEREARRRAVGLWTQPSPTPPWTFRQANPRSSPRVNR